ncbi:hypothetical protein HO415_10430 [Streptococcus suis]|nr:hypothetical protein [Streptococcus suis]
MRTEYQIEVDVTGLGVIKGRNGVYVVPNDKSLDISNRILLFINILTRITIFISNFMKKCIRYIYQATFL